ncbi:hypothetical protein GGI15_004288 [Coemansia interrupta]|uniref:Nucleolus and neural progenitor protein-like N-terminal domain-containing protein n=1 Tax=Coemansia interrupta TaxID=1126814 RepID=A0A9W8LF96_9FUNG|nr:hypothetical protein GGI15_004288 [Coemansia interrupta]
MDTEDATARRFVLPDCHAVPRPKLGLSEDHTTGRPARANPLYANVRQHAHVHAATVHMLEQLAQRPYASLVQHERQLVWRLYHRNHNQHRTSLHWRRMQALRRVLRAWDAARPHALVRGLLQQCLGKAAAAAEGGRWTALPCAEHVSAVAARLAEIVRLAGAARDACRAVFVCFTGLVRQTLFMPLALVVVGVAARLHVVFGVWRRELLDACRGLCDWVPALPQCSAGLGRWRLPDADALAAEVSGEANEDSKIRAYAEESVRQAEDTLDADDALDTAGAPPASSARRRARDAFLDLFD